MKDETDRFDEEVAIEAEEAAAAAEAAAIGGHAGDEDLPPAERPLVEAGEGEAEGFEVAEADLVERAEHGDVGYTGVNQFDEPEELGAANAYGEADEIESTEVVRDPESER